MLKILQASEIVFSVNIPPYGFELIIDEAEIETAIERLAVRLSLGLQDSNPLFVCVMNGALFFCADLLRRMSFDLELDYVHVARYASTRGKQLQYKRKMQRSLAGRTVVLVDEVFDEGITMSTLVRDLEPQAERVITVVLVDKCVPHAETPRPNFVALRTPNKFLIGRGMDLDGRYRNLASIYALKES